MREFEKIAGAPNDVKACAPALSIRRWSEEPGINQRFTQSRQTSAVKAKSGDTNILIGIDAGLLEHHACHDVVGAAVNADSETTASERFDRFDIGASDNCIRRTIDQDGGYFDRYSSNRRPHHGAKDHRVVDFAID